MKSLKFAISIAVFVIVNIFPVQALYDSLVVVRGNVKNEETGKPVIARISYEMLPYGDEVASISTEGDSSEFNIYLRSNGKYMVKVESEGYFPYVDTWEVAAMNSPGQLTKEIMLKPGGVGYVMKLEHLIFGQGSAEITEESYEELDKLVVMLKETPDMEIQLEGHTDFRGNSTANMLLSEQRVKAIKNYMVSKGIEGKRIKTKAFGGTQPVSRESTEEARSLNRRVEVRILKL